jgi:2-polyprenyl-3-methyl-5-hydroxy-6-metoxy-1,4-benzoquinol methylase
LQKINFYKGSFLELNEIKRLKFDVLIFNGVLEHLVDLNKTIDFINLVLKKMD